MSPELRTHRLLSLRALLVIAAIVCLCISSHVGLQLFPLNVGGDVQTLNTHGDFSAQASYAPEVDVNGFRVPIMAQSQKRADKETPQSNPFILQSIDRSASRTDTRFAIEVLYPVCSLTSVTTMPPAGRAPPLIS
jgi:hypothetical protein